jgi:CRP-like cAMP-binding protein
MVALALYALQENGLANLVGREPAAPAHEATRRAIRACAEHPIPLVRETALLVLAQQHQAGHHLTKEAQMLTTIEKLVFLKQVPFFQEMSIAQLHVLASISEEMDVAADETILSEGEYVDALYVLVSGRVALQRRQKRRQDSITRLATLGPRDYFAEMSVFDNEPLSADAVALEPTRLLLVRQSPLIALIKRHPEMGLALLKVLSQRLRQVDDRFAEKVKARPKKLVDLYDTLNDPKDTE